MAGLKATAFGCPMEAAKHRGASGMRPCAQTARREMHAAYNLMCADTLPLLQRRCRRARWLGRRNHSALLCGS